MKNLLIAVAAVAVFACASQAQAAEPQGQISDAQLAELGLGGMQTLSDDQWETIRGKFLFGPRTARAILNSFNGQNNANAKRLGALTAILIGNDLLRAQFPNGGGVYPPGTFITP
jgi:hypothetical protein